jgi:hypothetical protein
LAFRAEVLLRSRDVRVHCRCQLTLVRRPLASSPSPAPPDLHMSRVEKHVVPFDSVPPEHPCRSGPPLSPGNLPPIFHLSSSASTNSRQWAKVLTRNHWETKCRRPTASAHTARPCSSSLRPMRSHLRSEARRRIAFLPSCSSTTPGDIVSAERELRPRGRSWRGTKRTVWLWK